jgi:uncharacterized repeat protein (TIGR02543 family)
MTIAVRKRATTIAAIAATAGIASLFLAATPASAVTTVCGGGTLIVGNICEQSFTSGTATFTPTAQMSQLEVLLVAGGGDGADKTGTDGYAAAGGGGEVSLVGFGANTPTSLTLAVGGPGLPTTVSDGTTTTTAAPGASAPTDSRSGAASGNGNPGASGSFPDFPYGGGGGAGASPVGNTNGGPGVIAASLTSAGSLFSTDDNCYGGGGAVGIPGTAGTATCGGGQPTDATSASLIAPIANSGGGGGGVTVSTPLEQRQGASGLVVVRWIPLVTLSFVDNGHGVAVPPQTLAVGATPVQPADPTETGWMFNGWFTDAALTVPADFTAPATESTTFYASWSPVLAATGGPANGSELPFGIAALALGAGVFGLTNRRRVRAN